MTHYCTATVYCYEDAEGRLWLDLGETDEQVDQCPFCGFIAKVKRGEEP
ncbi:MAG TPA: hypothetical protein VKK79_21390 [Candidatus Lokiarchaeia archaeon]|nr:hypothetical protein [Candidatus Lokiarchaeia archaeon]